MAIYYQFNSIVAMNELVEVQSILNFSFLPQNITNIVFNAVGYYSITSGLIYCIYQAEYKKSRILATILGWSILAYSVAFIIEVKFWQLLQIDLISNYYLETKFFIAIALCCIILAIILFKNKGCIIAFEDSLLKEMERYIERHIKERMAAERAIPRLQAELEDKILERTAALSVANQELQESTSIMEKVADLTPNILYIYDLEQQRTVYSNRFIGEVLGYSEAEIEARNLQLFGESLHPNDRQLITKHHQNCLSLLPDDYLEVEYRMQDRNGNWHWLHSKDTVFERDRLGKPTQILSITQDITETKKIQSEAERLNSELAEKVKTLELWHEKRIKLAKMNEFLQACVTIEEAETALTDLLQPLFPNTHGAVYLMSNSKNMLNAIAAWGIPNSESSFEPHECWALRRGNKHYAHPFTPGLYCTHTNSLTHTTPTLCLPMIAKGKTLGMLYLRFTRTESINDLMQELAETVAQNIAMSVANIKLQEELRYQSLRDPLTGLYNRRYLQESLAKEIDRARRKQQFIGIIMVDIDYFKRFNDVYGHSAGDLVLKEVGCYLLSKIRHYDVACRYGGEELVIIMPDASIGDTVVRAEEIRAGVKQLKLEYQNQKLESISVSIGVSCFPDDGIDVAGLIRNADNALYRAKEQGRDRVERC